MTWDQARANELQRLRATWPSKTKGTLADPYPHLSGWCNPSFPLGHPSHGRCDGTGPGSPSMGYLGCICQCHTAGVIMCGDATDADMTAVRGFAAALRNGNIEESAAAVATQGRVNDLLQHVELATVSYGYGTAAGVDGATAEVIVTGDRWVWEADAAAEVMLQESGDCPMCTEAWDVHLFHDDGRVACP